MSDLFIALMFGAVGALGLVRRDRMVALNLEAYRRFPSLRRIPLLSRGHDSERYQRRLITFDAIFLLAMAVVYLIGWVVSR
jgi:hypothetical protein